MANTITILTRAAINRALTWAEMDLNWTRLRDAINGMLGRQTYYDAEVFVAGVEKTFIHSLGTQYLAFQFYEFDSDLNRWVIMPIPPRVSIPPNGDAQCTTHFYITLAENKTLRIIVTSAA